MRKVVVVMSFGLLLTACQSAYYEAAESFGRHKREILVDRVEAARDSQGEAEEQFQSAQEQLMALIKYDGGDLGDIYEDLADEYDASVAAAEDVKERIDAIEHVAEALFDEWEEEIEEFANARFKADSERKLRDTRRRYEGLIKAMRRSEQRMEPVLVALNDNVLYLKHNLNAQAVSALKVEFGQIEKDIDLLIKDMRKAIARSNDFIESMQQTQ
jgi:hypothetical protein